MLNISGVYTVTLTGYLPTSPYSPDPGWVGYLDYNDADITNLNCNASGGT